MMLHNEDTVYDRPFIPSKICDDGFARLKLSEIPHVMDCECFYINKNCVIYREVSLFNIKTGELDSIQCYAEDYPEFYDLDAKIQKPIWWCTKKVHGLKFLAHKRKKHLSQNELFEFLEKKFVKEKKLLVGYKGGNIESKLCKMLEIPAVNLEYFGIEKYEELLAYYDINIRVCCYHTSFFTGHCSKYEVLLFAAKICDKIGDIKHMKQILDLYHVE